MNTRLLLLSALVAFTGTVVRADTFVTITPTGSTAATVVDRWVIGSDQSGLGYIDGNSGFPSATATNFFTITGAAIPALGSPNGFTSYLPVTGAPTAQSSVGNQLTPSSYSGLTYVAENLSLIGPLSFYAIHHTGTGDYLALIQPSVPTVSDQKPMSAPGNSLTPGDSGYLGLSYASDNPGGWGAQLFYYLRTNLLNQTVFGSLVPALVSGPTDRWNLGASRGFTDLAYTTTNVGFGSSQFYYLRLDPTTQTSFFGHLNPATGVATDIQNLGGVYRTLVFTPTDVGFGANHFYSIRRPAQAQTISFAALAARTTCDLPFSITLPTATSALTVALSISGPATLAGNVITLTGATGTVTVTASQAGDINFNAAADVVHSFAVTACAPPLTAQAITFDGIATRTACDGPFTFAAPTASSGLAVTLSITGPATLIGNVITLTGGVGIVSLTASQDGNGTFAAAADETTSFSVTACAPVLIPQSIAFAAIGGRTTCDAPFSFTPPIATSGLAVTLAITGPATLVGNTITLTGAAGTVSVTASQAGNGAFDAASSVIRSFAVTACAPLMVAQTITFPVIPNRGMCDGTFALAPTATSALPVTLSVVSGPASILDNVVTITGAGTVTVQATQAGNGSFASATPVTRTFVAAKCAATVTLDHLTKTFYGTPFNALDCVIATTTPAGLAVVITYNGSTNLPAAVGSYTVVATIVDANYAGSATGTFVVSADARVAQTVSFGAPLPNRVIGDAPFTLNPTSSSGKPADLAVLSGPATVSGNIVTLTGVGTVVLEVSQAGDIATTLYAGMTQSFEVVAAVPNSGAKVAGSAAEVAADIRHDNGNIYDQVLLTGASATVTADANQVVRLSFIDLTSDIVQVEFSGAGSLTLTLDNATGPAAPQNYNQPDVAYMRGHARIVVSGANATTNLSVFSVGRVTAINQALFRDDVTYDGWADLASITILSPSGTFGSLRAGNASFSAAQGVAGIAAPGVVFSGFVVIGDIAAADSAQPVFQLGGAAGVLVAGGDMTQPGGKPIVVSGITELQFVGGSSSHGALIAPQANAARFEQGGTDITAQIVTLP